MNMNGVRDNSNERVAGSIVCYIVNIDYCRTQEYCGNALDQ